MKDPMIIEHDANAPARQSWYWRWGVYLIPWAAVAFVWAVQVRSGFDWEQIGIGAFTGVVFILSWINYTDNKLPKSWRNKQSSR